MRMATVSLALVLFAATAAAQTPAFDVASVTPVDPQPKSARFLKMEGPIRFVVKNFPLRLLIAAAYNLNSKQITGGPGWIDSKKCDIRAVTPGNVQPTRDQQMSMLATLLAERFQLIFHREQKDFSIYVLTIAKGGSKLKSSASSVSDPASVISTVYPDHILMPARNPTMQDFVAVLQRAILDRPVVGHTGLSGRFEFNLEWAPSEQEFGGDIPAPADSASPPLLVALQQELGLKLEATRGPAEAFVIDSAQQPAAG